MNDPTETGDGTACGMNAYADKAEASTISSLGRVMTDVAEWIEGSSGVFLGHVKMAVVTGESTMTLSLTNLKKGVDRRGSLEFGHPVEIKFMAAVVDVDHDELSEKMKSALASEGFRTKDKKNIVELR